MTNSDVRNLACAITMQAVKDYFDPNATPEKRKVILKELRSTWMDTITNGTSVAVADQLELHPKEIAARLRKYDEMGDDLL